MCETFQEGVPLLNPLCALTSNVGWLLPVHGLDASIISNLRLAEHDNAALQLVRSIITTPRRYRTILAYRPP